MPALRELVPMSKGQLDKIAAEQELRGRSKQDRVGLMIMLADEQVPEAVEALLRKSSGDLYDMAREAGVEGYSDMRMHQHILELLPEDFSGGDAPGQLPEDAPSDRVVRVYYPPSCYKGFSDGEPQFEGEVVGYCWPYLRPGVYTYLRAARRRCEEDSLEAVLAEASKLYAERETLRQVMQEPPPGTTVVDPPL